MSTIEQSMPHTQKHVHTLETRQWVDVKALKTPISEHTGPLPDQSPSSHDPPRGTTFESDSDSEMSIDEEHTIPGGDHYLIPARFSGVPVFINLTAHSYISMPFEATDGIPSLVGFSAADMEIGGQKIQVFIRDHGCWDDTNEISYVPIGDSGSKVIYERIEDAIRALEVFSTQKERIQLDVDGIHNDEYHDKNAAIMEDFRIEEAAKKKQDGAGEVGNGESDESDDDYTGNNCDEDCGLHHGIGEPGDGDCVDGLADWVREQHRSLERRIDELIMEAAGISSIIVDEYMYDGALQVIIDEDENMCDSDVLEDGAWAGVGKGAGIVGGHERGQDS
ncbi:uncharacterized protein H6S33_003278 [Morchella sextelata]|uniref:uncharacterized protein n=1 Tax=Morchella sextelata TaxID=1174677 RepID=UPI001D0466F0|nr:uncharacterized protein H6S33_003278 [Morchella sextelata]KAH0607290.1 hypothetical protein H6S33_003278 [Morchella sextelata]